MLLLTNVHNWIDKAMKSSKKTKRRMNEKKTKRMHAILIHESPPRVKPYHSECHSSLNWLYLSSKGAQRPPLQPWMVREDHHSSEGGTLESKSLKLSETFRKMNNQRPEKAGRRSSETYLKMFQLRKSKEIQHNYWRRDYSPDLGKRCGIWWNILMR